MTALVQKAEELMRMILVSSLLMAWAALRTPMDVITHARHIFRTVLALPPGTRNPNLESFVKMVKLQGGSESKDFASHRVAEILEVARECRWALTIRPPLEDKWTYVSDEKADALQESINSLARLRDTTVLNRRFEAFQQVLDRLMPGYELEREAQAIEDLLRQAGGDETQTLGELDRRLVPQVRIPIVNELVSAPFAAVVIALSLVGPLLYFSCLCLAMQRSEDISSPEAASWLFLHKGKWGPLLGSVWLCVPGVVMGLRWGKLGCRDAGLLALWIGLSGLAALCIAQALKARRLRAKALRSAAQGCESSAL